MAFGAEKLQASGGDVFKEAASLGGQFHSGFTADKETAAKVCFQLVDDAGYGRLAGVQCSGGAG